MKNCSAWNRSVLTSFIGIIAFAFSLTHNAVAQSPHVSGMRIDWGAWNFKPLYDDATGSARVTGFLALSKEDAATGDNIVAVWYVRNADQSWSKKSWLTSDTAEAIKHVKISTGIPDSDDERWEVDQDLRVLPSDNPETPMDYSMGLLTDDPLHPLVSTSSDAASIVSFLTDIGYKAADIAIDNSSDFSSDEQLDIMADAIELGHSMSVTDQSSANAQSEAMATVMAAAVVIQPGTPTCVPGITGPWTLGAITGPTACSWLVTDTWVTIMGGRTYTCSYEWCCTYTRSRSAPAVRANCSTYTCTQIEIQRVCSAPVVCTVFVATPTPPEVWTSPCGTSPTCSTLPPVVPPAPAVWTWPNSTNCP
jgi:hypothetical protein